MRRGRTWEQLNKRAQALDVLRGVRLDVVTMEESPRVLSLTGDDPALNNLPVRYVRPKK